MKLKAKVGDVFIIPLDDQSAAGGHVIAIREKEEYYIAVMGHRLRLNEKNLEVAIAGEPVLLALSFDAKLANGDWPIIGNLSDAIERYPHPAFKVKVGSAGVMSIVSRDETILRPASEDELEILQYRSVAYPMIIQDAIKAHFGLGEWRESDKKLRAEYAIASSKFLSKSNDRVI